MQERCSRMPIMHDVLIFYRDKFQPHGICRVAFMLLSNACCVTLDVGLI